jgi:hypothetical protein
LKHPVVNHYCHALNSWSELVFRSTLSTCTKITLKNNLLYIQYKNVTESTLNISWCIFEKKWQPKGTHFIQVHTNNNISWTKYHQITTQIIVCIAKVETFFYISGQTNNISISRCRTRTS